MKEKEVTNRKGEEKEKGEERREKKEREGKNTIKVNMIQNRKKERKYIIPVM